MPLIIAAFNLILAAFTLFSMLATVNRAAISSQVDYGTFLVIFRYVAIIEFTLILFMLPSLTAGSISGEREHRTLDLMLTTKLTPRRIVTGKVITSLTTIGILVVSSLPILALVFVYGGVTISNILLLFLSLFTVAVFTASIGIWASSISERSTVATAITYAAVLLFTGGTIGICMLATNFTGGSGKLAYILFANPAVTFYEIINTITGNESAVWSLRTALGFDADISPTVFFSVGTAVQLAISGILVLCAAKHVSPGKTRS